MNSMRDLLAKVMPVLDDAVLGRRAPFITTTPHMMGLALILKLGMSGSTTTPEYILLVGPTVATMRPSQAIRCLSVIKHDLTNSIMQIGNLYSKILAYHLTQITQPPPPQPLPPQPPSHPSPRQPRAALRITASTEPLALASTTHSKCVPDLQKGRR